MEVVLASAADAGSYWDEFYRLSGAPLEPSSFASKAAERWPNLHTVIDIGCGNGRDSDYFVSIGRDLIGIDSCTEAIAACRRQAANRWDFNGSQPRFLVSSAADQTTWRSLAASAQAPVLIYARFLFHAVPEATEAAILEQASALLKQRGGALCAEFRTTRDETLSKAMPAHYRRFVDPGRLCEQLESLGLEIVERTEGQGFAVFRGEDAHVARIHACPR